MNLFRKTMISALLLAVTPSLANAVSVSDFVNRQNCDQVIDKVFYSICYDYKAKGAKYVRYVLSGTKVDFVNLTKRPRFYAEQKLPKRFRVYPSDYRKNEFHADRGHLAPDASFDWSSASLKSTYSMANIIPQFFRVNRKTWIKAEKYERLIAKRLGSITVVNGVDYGTYSNRLRKGGSAIPVAFWKMLFKSGAGFSRCFYFKNKKISKATAKADRLRDHEVDCASLLR